MGETLESGARLEVSVSFGRFEGHDLSWEKWSSFSQNKYLEEVGTLSTPGSVAQKKAYFEAHYKKIAAKKAEEELGLEKSMDDHVEKVYSIDEKLGLLQGDEEVHTEVLMKVLDMEEGKEIPEIVIERDCNEIEVNPRIEFEHPMDSESQIIVERDPNRETGDEKPNSSKEENFNLSSRERAHKDTQNKRDKATVPVMKPYPALNPRQAKPKPKPKPVPAPLQKNKNGSTLPTGKNASLHMSMNLGTGNSSSTARKSLIMEKSGAENIAKGAAFKTHPNQVHPPSTLYAGLRKDTEKIAAQRNPPGSRLKPVASGSYKSLRPGNKTKAAFSPSTGLRSDERAEKRKEFLKKLEAKSIATEAENAQLNAKSKHYSTRQNLIQEEKESEMRKFRQSLNFKAKPLPAFYRSSRKTHSAKETADNEVHH